MINIILLSSFLSSSTFSCTSFAPSLFSVCSAPGFVPIACSLVVLAEVLECFVGEGVADTCGAVEGIVDASNTGAVPSKVVIQSIDY